MTFSRIKIVPVLLVVFAAPSAFLAQQSPQDASAARTPFHERSSSEITFSVKGGDEIIEILNTTYEVTGTSVPGRPPDERLVLRKMVRSMQIIDNVGVDATTTVEAWPFGSDLKQKPLYSIELSGTEARTVDNALVAVSRGVEEVDWWSVYKLGTGQLLFDTYVPLVSFSISRENLTMRYVGLEIPPDDAEDARLKEPRVVAVVSYASSEGVIREALVTCEDPKQAAALRSYSDESRAVSLVETSPPAAKGRKGSEPSQSIKISFSQTYPGPPSTLTVVIPLSGDNLDLTHAHLPPHLHVGAWQR
jgi:hypothetical protein